MTYQFDFASLLPYWRDFAAGVWLTLQLSGVRRFWVSSAARSAPSPGRGPPWLQRVVGAYVEVIRNTPLLVQIFLVYFGIAVLGLRVDATFAAVLALVVNVVAYTCEIMRAGIESIHRAQVEAGECLGLTAARSTGTWSCARRSSGSTRPSSASTCC